MTRATMCALLASSLLLTANLCPAQTTGYLWGASGTSNSLQTFDVATGAVVTGITVASRGGLIYVARDGVTLLAPNNATLAVLSGVTGKLLKTVTLPDYGGEAVFSPDGTTAYIAGSHSIMAMSLGAYTVTQHQVAGAVGALAVSPDGTKIYAAVKGAKPTETGICSAAGRNFTGLCAFDTSSFKLLAQRPLFYGQVMVSQDGKTVYSLPEKSPQLAAMDPNTLKVTARLIGGGGSSLPFSMNVSPAGNQAVVFIAGAIPPNLFVEAMLLNTQTNQLNSLYVFSFSFPTLYGNVNPLLSTSAAFSADGTSLWMLSATGSGTNPTLLGVDVPSGTVIANTAPPLATSEVIF